MAHLEFEKPIVELEQRIRELKLYGVREKSFEAELAKLEERAVTLSREIYADLSVWQKVQLSRHPDRPYFLDYVERLFDDVVELHGDRGFGDDAAIVAGFARLDGQTVAVIGHQKGRTTKEKVRRNFGMAHPEGYRKAMRVMELADRFKRPVLTFIDTAGAYPGVAAEQHGQGGAIARSQARMVQLGVPTVACVIGEGGSGGAIAIAVADRVLMQENAIYSVITPEGCAAILWRDAGQAQKAAAAFKPDAAHCLELGVIDAIVPEPLGGAQADFDEAAQLLAESIEQELSEIEDEPGTALRRQRRAKFRAMGVFGAVV